MSKALTVLRKVKDSKRRILPGPPPPAAIPEKEQIQNLKKAWKKDLPESELSFHTADGDKIYFAIYPGKGVVIKMGNSAKPFFSPPGMGYRIGMQLAQASNQARFPRV